jgi:hypothetical protein
VPTGLKANASGGTAVQLNWNSSTDAGTGVAGYHVYRGGAQPVATVTGTSFLDTGLSPGTLYIYTVSAFDYALPSNESSQSATTSLVTPSENVPPPTAPTGLTVSIPGSPWLFWGGSTFPATGISGYRIYRNGILIYTITFGTTTNNQTSFLDLGASPSTTYTYTVTAFDLSATPNESAASNSVTITTPGGKSPPTVPTGLTATALSGPVRVALNWGSSTYSGTGTHGYRVYRDGTLLTTISAVANVQTGYIDSSVSPSTTYTYTVTGFDPATTPAESAPSNQVSLTTPPGNNVTAVRINAGGFGYTDSSNNTWTADSVATGGSKVDWGAHAVGGTNDPTLFVTEAYGQNLQYTVNLPNGNYTVNLYFCENWVDSTFPNGGVGFRVFSVQANGATIVSNLDVFATVGRNVALVKTATVSVTNGQLVLSSPGGWMVNAIEIIGQ